MRWHSQPAWPEVLLLTVAAMFDAKTTRANETCAFGRVVPAYNERENITACPKPAARGWRCLCGWCPAS